MTQFEYSNERDKKLIENSFNYLAWLTFGKNNQELIRQFRKIFNSRVKYIKVIPYGDNTEHIGSRSKEKAGGMCFALDEDNAIYAIEMFEYKNALIRQYDFIRHEGIHKLCHAFADILPLIYGLQSKIKEGTVYRNQSGLISEKDENTGEFVGQHYYGKMFNETMMDIFSTMGLVAYDPNFKDKNVTADTVLKFNYKDWKNATTGYSVFTSITRLAIAAFSNNGNVKYNDLIQQGIGLVDIEYSGNDEEYIVRNIVEKGLSQVVSRSHSRKNFFRRAEQFVVFSLPKI